MDQKCIVEGCEAFTHRKKNAYCSTHYWRFRHHGRPELPPRKNKRYHPLYIRWHEKRADRLSEWNDFWRFAADVGECPGDNFTLEKIDNSIKWGSKNFQWKENLAKLSGETDKEWYARKWKNRQLQHPHFERQRHLQRRFQITPEIYAGMSFSQDHKCAICRKPEIAIHKSTGNAKRLAVDHCHNSKKIRGLLCWRCNSTLGKVGDSIELLQAMISYLRKHE